MAENPGAVPRWPGDDKDFRVTMGLHTCHPDNWLLRGPEAEELIANKNKVLTHHHDEAVAVLPEGDAAAREAAHLICTEVISHQVNAADAVDSASAHECEDAQHPLEQVCRVIAEDVCIMTPHHSRDDAGREVTEYRLTAAVLCAPSRWSLREKLGTSLRSIHAPVPGYESIEAPTDSFFDRLRVEDIMERTNWSVLKSPELFQPGGEPTRPHLHDHTDNADGTGNTEASRLEVIERDASILTQRWLRLERQTLRKLPNTGAVVFTILTTNARLDVLATEQPAAARQLAHKMRTSSQDTRAYKSWPDAEKIADALEAACSAA